MIKTIAGPYGSINIDMTPEEIAQRQADEATSAAPAKSIGDTLRDFLFESLEANINLIDAATELRIRQLQKTLEALPNEMGDLRFAQGVRPLIVGFEIPDVPAVAAIKSAILGKIDEVITNAENANAGG